MCAEPERSNALGINGTCGMMSGEYAIMER
jgi:hypothetical protein